MKEGYPLLKENIFFAKIKTDSGLQVKIRNTTTEKDFKANPATVQLLDLCTGTKSVGEITDQLSRQSGEPREEVAEGVQTFLETLCEKGVVTMRSTPLEAECKRVKNVKVNHPIETAQIEITNKCNLSCTHCINDSGAPLPDELTTEEIFSTIDELSSLGVHTLVISGGEPLLHPNLFEIVKYARKAPMTVTIFTNGILITEETIRKFVESGVTRFSVSIDSMNEHTHDAFRGQEGTLKKTLKGINLLKEAGFSVRLSVSVIQMNKRDIVDVLKYFKEQNFTDYLVGPVVYSGRGLDNVVITPEEYYDVCVEQFTYLKEEFPEGISRIYPRETQGCGIASDRIGIKADGTILPCPGCTKEMGIGNVRTCDLKELWDKDKTVKMLRNIRVEEDTRCSGCRYLAFCGGCVVNAFVLEKEFRCHDPYNCALHRAYDEVIGLE